MRSPSRWQAKNSGRPGFFAGGFVRTAAILAVLILLAPLLAQAKPQARKPWLLFPLDVRRFDHVSSKFGLRRMQGRRKLHRGVDLVAPPGSWVVAAREGRVKDTGRARACGWYVTVQHDNGWRTIYCHLRFDPKRLGIAEGMQVPALGVVGEVGSTGHSTGPHLHFSLLDERGQPRDPLLALYTPAETLRVLKKMGMAR
jgi:murein DD-endopeptidase MepM/ murein hydrolase activator NlpD